MDIEIKDFKNFSQFLAYSRQHVEEMRYWSPEQMKEYTDKVMALCESDSEFREQYTKWARNLANKQKTRVTIGGSEKDAIRSQALLKLKKIQQQRKNDKERETPKQSSPNPDIVILAKRKKTYSI